MQNITKTIGIIAIVLLTACGNKQNAGSALAEKKAELEKLQKEQKSITDKIASIEKEIAKLDTSSVKEDKSKLVSITALATQPYTHYLDLQGKIEAVNIAYVTPRGGGGQVKQLFVKKGDAVKKGQLLVKLDDALIKTNIAAANQSLETIKTQLSFAKNIYQKQKSLWEQNIGTEVQLITAKNNVETLENQLKASLEQIKVLQEQLNFTNIYADVAGVAEDVNVRVGEFFNGVAQIKIVNTNDLKVTTQIPENYINAVKVGSKVKINFPDLGKKIEATITVTGKLIDPNSRSFYAEAKIPFDKELHPNQIAIVNIQDYSNAQALVVPVNTVQADQNGKFVMVAIQEKGKLIARKKPVVLGELYEDKVEIHQGLQVGDQLITDGFQSLYDGQAITTSAK